MRDVFAAVAAAAAVSLTGAAQAQVVPPGALTIDGIPVFCGNVPTLLSPAIPDVGINTGQAIVLNPLLLNPLPTVLKLYVYAHECAHSVVGPDEVTADCWAVQLGRDQGWFPPEAFALLMGMFAGNPGSLRHPPGPLRVRLMQECYGR